MCAIGGLLAIAPDALAGPSPGARYDGRSEGRPVWLRVAKDGTRLAKYVFQTRIPCTDGKRRIQGLIAKGEGPVMIDANGAFSYTAKPQRAEHRTRKGLVRGPFTLTVSGAFSPAGDVVSGTIDTTFRSKRFDCSSGGAIPFTAHLDGTPGAPWRDATLATGIYKASVRGLDFEARVLAPGKEMVRATLAWAVRCDNGEPMAGRHVYSGFDLSKARMAAKGRTRSRIGPGKQYVATDRIRLSLRFTGGATYAVRGRWRVRSVVRRDGAFVTVCRFESRFAGRWVSGPG